MQYETHVLFFVIHRIMAMCVTSSHTVYFVISIREKNIDLLIHTKRNFAHISFTEM